MIHAHFIIEIAIVLLVVNIRSKKLVIIVILLTSWVLETLIAKYAWRHVFRVALRAVGSYAAAISELRMG